jgi:hypothetical protein
MSTVQIKYDDNIFKYENIDKNIDYSKFSIYIDNDDFHYNHNIDK